MAWYDLFWPFYQTSALTEAVTGVPILSPVITGKFPTDQSGQGDDKAVMPGFLTICAAIGVGACYAPALYIAYKGRKRGKKARTANEATYLALEGASNRATSLLAGLAPAFAMPIAYIGVQELENKGVITKSLGDAVQGLMTAGVVAPAIGNIIGSIARAAK